MAHACRYTHIIITNYNNENLERTGKSPNPTAFSLSPSFTLFSSPFPPSLNMFIRMFYAARAIMQFAYRIRAGHLSETSRSFCWRICQDQPGSWLPIGWNGFKVERERERENRNSSRNDLACTANTTTNLHEKEASFRINNGNATGFHFPASNRSLSRPFERPSAEFSPNGSSLPRIKRLP